MEPLYLDNAATTPLAPEVREAMAPYLGAEFGNPSSRHPLGVRAEAALDLARARVGRALGARPQGVIFTSGGTEANNLAVLGIARAAQRLGKHVLVGPTEHASVRAPALQLAEEGFEVEFLRLDGEGSLDLADAERKLRPDTVLVAQMLASNELGSVYPLRELARRVRAISPRARIFADLVQAFGKLECSPLELEVDAVSLSAHKIHGPKGAGALVLAGELPLRPLVFGGDQERGLRSGTQNVPAAVGLGLAAELAERERETTARRLAEVARAFAEAVREIPGARILRLGERTLPPLDSIVPVLVSGAPAEVRMHHLEQRGVLVSSASACQSKSRDISPAHRAAGLDPDQSRRVLRFSFSRYTTPDEARRAAQVLAEVSRELDAVAR
jgi:cysteine desulfurase